MVYQTVDTTASLIVGTFVAFLTGYGVARLTSFFSKPRKSMEQVITEYVVHILNHQGALRAISLGLNGIEHPDAELFEDVLLALSATNEDQVINEWLIRAVLILSADINNRIDSIVLSKTNDILGYIDENYEIEEEDDDEEAEDDAEDHAEDDAEDDEADAEDDEAEDAGDEAEENVNESEEDISGESATNSVDNDSLNVSTSQQESEDESDVEGEPSGSSSPVRIKRALTHFSDASSSSNENKGTPATPPASDASSTDEPVTNGESSPSEPINSTSESNTASVEQSGNSENTSENS